MNPYLNRVMIQDPNQFYGRRSEVRRILARIGADRPQSISLVGDRRIGKSSLLYYLTHPEVQERHLADTSSLVIVFLDFQQIRHITLERFFLLLMDQIRRADVQAPVKDRSDYNAFQDLLEAFHERKKKLILLFDEFQAITTNPAFNNEFYSFLRSMANNYEVAYVTTSSVELQRLCCSSDISDSPFFNIFSNLYLKTLERDEAYELISKPSKEHGAPLQEYAEEIINIAGLFPIYLQIACSIFFDFLKENPEKKPNPSEVKDRFLEEAAPHFEYFWEHATAEYQTVLNRLIGDEQPNPEEMHLCEALRRKGYLIQDQDRFKFFSPVFAEHIRMISSSSGEKTRVLRVAPDDTKLLLRPGVNVHQYQILRKAGEGGMGVVYEAKDSALHRKVALKFIKPELLLDQTSQKRFLKEARSAASLSHPTIASVYELFEYGWHQGLALEWIEGTTLKQRILKQGRIELRQAVAWMIEAMDGLENAHENGIIHRDINSNNLMITSRDQVKITDFGLAQSRSSNLEVTGGAITNTGALIGTVDYMSPEQANGVPVDTRSDLFSLGVVFFEALTGELPFKGKTAIDTLHSILHKPVPSLSLYGIEPASTIDLLLNKLLAKSPENRYSSVSALREDFLKLLC